MQPTPIPRWIPISLTTILCFAVAGFFFRGSLVEALGWNQVQQTRACLQIPLSSELAIQPQMTRLVLGKKVNTLLISASQLCVQKDQTLRLMPRLNPQQWVLRKQIATAQIQNVRHTSWNKIDKKMAQMLGYSNINALKRDLLGQFGPGVASQPLALAQFQLLTNDYFNSRSRVIPFETPYARALNRQWTQHLIQKGIPVFDIRPTMLFKKERIPRSQSAPYHFGKYPKNIIYARFDKILRMGDSINLDVFPKNKEAPFIIYGQNPTDVAALRTLAIVHRYGWRKVYWYWGGMDGWANRPIIPPSHDPRIQLMT